jgi:2-hydroxychromene-2-carboxylate isomerase
MPAFVYPEPWPNNGLQAMRVATWAYSAGAGRRFARAGFEVQFNDGLALSEQENVELAAHRAGLDPHFAIEAAQDPVVKQALIDNTQRALDQGAIGVPTIVVGDEAFWGDDRLRDAVAAAASL